jgi:hypothetical protein
VPKPLTIYTFIPHNASASYYYRIAVPLRTAAELGLPVQPIIDTNIEGTSPQERIKNFCEADVVMMYQPVGEGSLHNVRMAKSFIPSKRDDAWKYPPTFVMETDDNLFRVSPHNPAFLNLGVSDPAGNPIPKGYSISEVREGVRRVLWKDGENGFDVERNHQAVETYRQLLSVADAVTCTTPRVAQAIMKEANIARTRIFPNLVRFDHYPQLDLVKDPRRIKILWQGGQNHYEDWTPLKNQIRDITVQYPEVHWVIWGVLYHWVAEVIPPDRYTFMPWCGYEEYKLRRVMIGEDINLAPLVENDFNNCRSAIKWYEASVQKRPAATLAQDTGPYHDEIDDGETGLIFKTPEEFGERLSLLIENSELRKQLGENAKQWLSENRDAWKEVPKQIAYLEDLRSLVELEYPHMPEAAWTEFEERMKAEQAEREKKEKEEAKNASLQPVH